MDQLTAAPTGDPSSKAPRPKKSKNRLRNDHPNAGQNRAG
jgi:hypothetical protein